MIWVILLIVAMLGMCYFVDQADKKYKADKKKTKHYKNGSWSYDNNMRDHIGKREQWINKRKEERIAKEESIAAATAELCEDDYFFREARRIEKRERLRRKERAGDFSETLYDLANITTDSTSAQPFTATVATTATQGEDSKPESSFKGSKTKLRSPV